MSSIFSTQKRHTFLRRKYCFFWDSTALSPPVGRWDALPGLPLDSAIIVLSFPLPYGRGSDLTVAALLGLMAAREPVTAPECLAFAPPPMAAPGPGPQSLFVGRAFHDASCAFRGASRSRRC